MKGSVGRQIVFLLFAILLAPVASPLRAAGPSAPLPSLLPGTRVMAIGGGNGQVYVATERGLAEAIRAEDGRLEFAPVKPALPVFALDFREDGTPVFGASSGAFTYSSSRVVPLAMPPGARDEAVTAIETVKSAKETVFLSGAFGLVELAADNRARFVPLPEAMGAVTALESEGPDLYVAGEGSLWLFRTLRAEWTRLERGTTYLSLAFFSPGAVVGLASDGNLRFIRVLDLTQTGGGFSRLIPPPLEGAPFSSILVSEKSGKPSGLAGNHLGRIYEGQGDDATNLSWRQVYPADDIAPGNPIRSLYVSREELWAGSDGAGLSLIDAKGSERRYVSGSVEPLAAPTTSSGKPLISAPVGMLRSRDAAPGFGRYGFALPLLALIMTVTAIIFIGGKKRRSRKRREPTPPAKTNEVAGGGADEGGGI